MKCNFSSLEKEQPLDNKDMRCICNKLICQIDNNVIEIKCNKCKRIIRILTKEIIDIKII